MAQGPQRLSGAAGAGVGFGWPWACQAPTLHYDLLNYFKTQRGWEFSIGCIRLSSLRDKPSIAPHVDVTRVVAVEVFLPTPTPCPRRFRGRD